ncbi:MAG: class I SAM-dependent methyltransferase, partial [Planctomycetota bacterium]
MTENPSAADWASARGDKWLAHLAGMEATLQPVDAPLLRALRLDAPCRIADLGCGGGRTTRELLRRAPAGSSVHGFDISPALVAVARAADASSAIRFDTADVATAVHGPFDRLASRFGVMFFDDPPAAFANLRRWLASGGRFAFAVWGPTGDNPWMTTVRDTVAGFVDVPPPDPDAPGPFRYAKVDTLLGHLRHAGFADLAAHA